MIGGRRKIKILPNYIDFGFNQITVYLPKFFGMESNASTTKSWVYFTIWFVILIGLFMFYRQYFWLALPGVITYSAKGLRLF